MTSRREFLRLGTVAAALAVCGLRPERESRALRAGIKFLLEQQSSDGVWRSAKYSAFRDGDALTPLILQVLLPMRAAETAVSHSLRWLEQLTDSLAADAEPWTKLRYPLFTASESTRVFDQRNDSRLARFWRGIVGQLRITEDLGWIQHPALCGAWSDSPAPPRLTVGTEAIPDMLAPNVSATLFGLRSVPSGALPFLFACQNFSTQPEGSFDDGGFFFALEDPIRNKAGAAGKDSHGHQRFRSFGSATCDGLLALRLCGLSFDHPRIESALKWLREQVHGMQHAGDWPASRAEVRDSLTYYYSQSLAEVLAWASSHPHHHRWAQEQRRRLIDDLEAKQNPDGSWASESPDSCEDEPLLATAFAMRALLTLS